MTTTTFAVTGMTCSHCVAAVTAEVTKISGVTAVDIDLDEAERMADVKVFHAGTMLRSDPSLGRDGRIATDGGRVLDVTALGANLAEAQARAYEAARAIRFNGGWYRRDIAEKAVRASR